MNALDCVGCVSILIHCITGLYYNNAAFVVDSGASDLDFLLVAVNAITFAAIISLYAITLTENMFRKSHTKVIAKAMGRVIPELQSTLRTRSDVVIEELFESAKVAPSMQLGSEVVHPTFGIGRVRDLTEKPSLTVTVIFENGSSQFFERHEDLAQLTLTTGKVNDTALCEQFKAAVTKALAGTSITASNFVIEALFYVLLLVTCEEDSHTLLLSNRVRDAIGQRDGISKAVVRTHTNAIQTPPMHATHAAVSWCA